MEVKGPLTTASSNEGKLKREMVPLPHAFEISVFLAGGAEHCVVLDYCFSNTSSCNIIENQRLVKLKIKWKERETKLGKYTCEITSSCFVLTVHLFNHPLLTNGF